LRQLYEFSTRDALTGVYNRRHFDERLRSELAFAIRHNTPLGLILLDVDRFKQINDVHGHLGGDKVLAEIAHRLVRMLRGEDLVARYGGEEFAVLLRSSDIPGCVHAAERLRAAVEEAPCRAGDRKVSITISGGCACLAECNEPTAAALIALADERLYAAKKRGRNRIVADD
jgi:two-component system cell cycle response regulator